MDKKLQEHEAHFKPTADDGEKMLQIKEDMKVLMKNNNHIAEWFLAIDKKMDSDRKRMDTLDNIIAKLTDRIKGLEDFLFRDKDKTR